MRCEKKKIKRQKEKQNYNNEKTINWLSRSMSTFTKVRKTEETADFVENIRCSV